MVIAEAAPTALCQARRILVLGSPGSGKTLLSTALARHLGLNPLRLDDFFWQAGRVRTPTDAWRVRVAELASQPSWIMDGTYEASLDLRLPAADALIYIQSSRWACLWRVVTRRLLSRWRPVDESAHGHALTAFFIRYVFRFPAVTQPEVFRLIVQHGGDKPLVVLDGAREVDLLIRQLARGVLAAGAPGDAVSTQERRMELQRNRHT
jgi:adenylate kinase family enzyme